MIWREVNDVEYISIYYVYNIYLINVQQILPVSFWNSRLLNCILKQSRWRQSSLLHTLHQLLQVTETRCSLVRCVLGSSFPSACISQISMSHLSINFPFSQPPSSNPLFTRFVLFNEDQSHRSVNRRKSARRTRSLSKPWTVPLRRG